MGGGDGGRAAIEHRARARFERIRRRCIEFGPGCGESALTERRLPRDERLLGEIAFGRRERAQELIDESVRRAPGERDEIGESVRDASGEVEVNAGRERSFVCGERSVDEARQAAEAVAERGGEASIDDDSAGRERASDGSAGAACVQGVVQIGGGARFEKQDFMQAQPAVSAAPAAHGGVEGRGAGERGQETIEHLQEMSCRGAEGEGACEAVGVKEQRVGRDQICAGGEFEKRASGWGRAAD